MKKTIVLIALLMVAIAFIVVPGAAIVDTSVQVTSCGETLYYKMHVVAGRHSMS